MSENTKQISDDENGSADADAEGVSVTENNANSADLIVRLQTILKAALYRIFRLTGEITAIVLGVAFVWLCAMNILIAQRVADVSFLKADASRWFSGAFEGKSADVGQMTLAWEAADNTVIFRAKNISVNSADGVLLNKVSFVETELALRDLVGGKLDPIRVVVDGGELSFLRDEDGNFIAGLGTPDTVGQFGPVWRGQKNDGDNDLEIGRIKSLKIDNAKIYIRDAGVDYAAQLNDANFDVAFVPDMIVFDITAELSRNKTASSAPLHFKGSVSPDLQNIDATFDGENLNPATLLPKLAVLKPVLGLDAPLDLKLRTLSGREEGLQQLDLQMSADAGTLTRNGITSDFKSATLNGNYDPASQTLNIEELALNSDLVSTEGMAVLSNLGSPADGLFSKDTRFELALGRLEWDGASFGVEPVTLSDVSIKGQNLKVENKIELEALSANFGTFHPRLKGALTRDDDGTPIAASLSGQVDGTLTSEQLLKIWPQTLLSGARRWVDNSIVDATLFNLGIQFDAGEAELSGQPLKDSNLTVTFDLRDGEVKYISTMTPITQVVGKGRLLGNQVEFVLKSGRVDDVLLERGKLSIPRIFPFGGDLVIEGEGTGPVRTLIKLLDQKPFEYITPYGVDPEDFSGAGAIKLSVTRPLSEKFTYDQVRYEVSGKLTDVSAPFAIGKNKLTDGAVTLLADRNGLSVKGPVNIGPWQADIVWREVFDNGATPTRYQVNGRLNQSDLDSFGFSLREFIGGGDIILSIDAEADGLAISRAKLIADLSETNMRIGPYWDKPKGVDAMMTGMLSFTKDKQLFLEDIVVKSSGLDLAGALNIGADFKLLDLNFTRAKIAGFIDAATQIKPSPDQKRFDVYVTGDYLDVSPFIDGAFSGGGSGVIDVPVLLTGAIGRLVLNESYILKDTTLLFAHNGIGVTEARLKGLTGEGSLAVNLKTDDEKDLRTLEIDIPDASDAAFALFGMQSLKGGRLQVNADLPAVGVEGPLTGTVIMEDVKVVEAPIMTTMLSLASLQGLADALGGGGLKFDSLEMPFSYEQGRLSVREGRASGPGLGMTGNGEIDFSHKALDMDGVLVPAYTANSLLGSIPLIGDIFVGKKGEGIFALNYTVQGPFDQALVAVNPLSALTPGFLRGIFATKRDELPEQLRNQIEELRPAGEAKEAP